MPRRKYYFAYGSNMDTQRMQARCPGARLVGPVTLAGFRLAERLYADIEQQDGATVDGILWAVTKQHLKRLDECEGTANGVYRRRICTVVTEGNAMTAVAYEMTEQARRQRCGCAYPEWYRRICARGASQHGLADTFTKTATEETA